MGIISWFIHIFCRALPFPGSVVLAIVFMPMILLIDVLFLSLLPSCPFASVRHMRKCVLGIVFMICSTCAQCSVWFLACILCVAHMLLELL